MKLSQEILKIFLDILRPMYYTIVMDGKIKKKYGK